MNFYDTNALLELQEKVFDDFFFISSTTLLELEDIKVNRNKDDEIKYSARKLQRLLNENQGKYHVIVYEQLMDPYDVRSTFGVQDSPDVRICMCARFANDHLKYDGENWVIVTEKVDNNIIFVTNDLSCKQIAYHIFDLSVSSTNLKNIDDYSGYAEVVMSEEEMADFYQNLSVNKMNLLMNQYLIIKDENGEIKDRLKWDGNEFQQVKFPTIKSNLFGSVKPYNSDVYQQLVLDSLAANKITMIKGPAGTGKSYLAIGYMLWLLEKHKIDRIVIFANPTPTANAAKLGFLPGSQLEKLTDSSLGNMLGAKLGDKIEMERLVADHKLDILPMCDIRGFDTTGLNCAVYITEAQNLDISLMKLALQRIGEDSIAIIEGDFTAQVDLQQYAGNNNGMRRLSEVFRGQDFYGEIELKNIYRGRIARLAESM
jgi:predicted ribonuclease YlaK